MDKRNLYFLLFAALVWLGWAKYMEIMYPPKKRPVVKAPAEKVEPGKQLADAQGGAATAAPGDGAEVAAADKKSAPEPPKIEAPPVPERDDILLGGDVGSNFQVYARLTNRGGAVTRLQLNRYLNEFRDGPFVLLKEETPLVHSFVLTSKDNPADNLGDKNWEVVSEAPGAVVFRTVSADGTLQWEKRFSLDPTSDMIRLEIAVRNLSDRPRERVQYQLTGGNGLPIEGAWFTNVFRDVVVAMVPKNGASPFLHVEPGASIGDREKQPVFSETPIQFAGVTSQYFASVVVQDGDPLSGRLIESVLPLDLDVQAKTIDANKRNLSVEVTAAPIALAAGQEVVQTFLLYNGPKERSRLDAYANLHLPLLIHYPNVMFLPIDRIAPIMVGILNFFHSWTGDYGVSIILLTLLVRACMFPLTFRQTIAMQKMQALNPKMQELREKYANDKEKLNRALMDLYAKEKVNPLGGCLPMLIQLPIFIGLWQSLSNSFSLRQSCFLYCLTWIKDLSAPDQLWQFPAPLPVLGPYLNLLPIISVGQMILQMRYLSPPATNPEQEMQKKVMSFMMVFIGFMFYKVPAGLCVYIITSGLWSLAERKLLPKPASPPGAQGSATVKEGSVPASSNGVSWISPIKPKKKDKARRS